MKISKYILRGPTNLSNYCVYITIIMINVIMFMMITVFAIIVSINILTIVIIIVIILVVNSNFLKHHSRAKCRAPASWYYDYYIIIFNITTSSSNNSIYSSIINIFISVWIYDLPKVSASEVLVKLKAV